MAWLAMSEDVENSAAIREEHLAAHLVYIEAILHKIEVGGPMNTEENPEYTSSAIIYKVETEAEAKALFEADPYFKAGLYASTILRQFKPVVGNWVGGKNW